MTEPHSGRRPYQAPAVQDLGSIAEITQGGPGSQASDASMLKSS